MSRSRLICADVLDGLAQIESESVQCVVTSPPYWGLRDYGAEGQIGLEKTPAEYVAKLVAVFEEVKRVLRKDGTLWLNLGDSYGSGSRTTQEPQTFQTNGDRHDLPVARGKQGFSKQLVGIPWRVAFALQAAGWYLRSDIIWAKPNPMPESVTDRPTKSHEYVFLLTKAQRYFYDAAAIAESAVYAEEVRWDNGLNGHGGGESHAGQGTSTRKFKQDGHGRRHEGFNGRYFNGEPSPVTRNARSVWTIATKPYAEAHFATFPPELAARCVKAGSKPDDLVLDPFAGSGTVGVVCGDLKRDFVGIELNPKYVEMAERRIKGPLFAEAAL